MSFDYLAGLITGLALGFSFGVKLLMWRGWEPKK